MKNNGTIPPELNVATDELIRNLVSSKPLADYARAREQMHSDPQAHALLERLSGLQTDIRRKQAGGAVTQEDLKNLRAAQADVQSNGAIIAYAVSQQEAVSFLREINREISELLGMDFASLARQRTC
jgi:cell fate (sporulation/competence/biofilm development) regulator YlbF (YheA/YmcA/DUF963 family)